MAIGEIKRKIKRVFSIKFVRDLMVMQTGSFFSTGLAAIASVIYARVLGIESYAAYALIFAFVGLGGIFMNLGAVQTVLTLMSEAYVKKNREEIKYLGGYFIQIGLLTLFGSGLILILIAPIITGWFYHRSDIGELARLVLLANAIQISWNYYTVVLQVTRRIKRLTLIENINSLAGFLLNISAVACGFGLGGVIWAYFVSSVFFSIYAIGAYRRLEKQEPLLPPLRQLIFSWDRRKFSYYFKFGFLVAIDKNLSNFYTTLPIFILGRFSLSFVAYLKVAAAYAQIPLLLVGPVGRLLMVQLPQSKAYSYFILKRDYIRSTFGSFLICLACAAPLVALSSFLITLMYGQKFAPAVYLSWPLIAGAVVSAIGVGDGPIYRVLHLIKQAIVINVVVILLGVVVIYGFARFLPINWSVYPIAAFLPVASVISFYYAIFKLNHKIKSHETNAADS